MRTTISPEPGIADQIRRLAAESGRSMNAVANELLARALDGEAPPRREPFKVRAYPLGLMPGIDPERVTKSAQALEDAEWAAERAREEAEERNRQRDAA